jgi:hypothetical protein
MMLTKFEIETDQYTQLRGEEMYYWAQEAVDLKNKLDTSRFLVLSLREQLDQAQARDKEIEDAIWEHILNGTL